MSESADRVQRLFDQAVLLPPQQRAAFLETACAGDPYLRAEVESLLACDAEDVGNEGLLRSPLVRVPKDEAGRMKGESDSSLTRPPSSFPGYRILRLLGQGGMGAVYEAEQVHPHRVVALKVIRPGLVSPALLKRFAHEADILGRLHHPGIAQIYEAGVAEDGQPFFALELIRGLPLDEYARRENLSTAARLELVARVCDAVQHAHEQGVIHRDLKPGNILVDGSGQPRVLDFGVARATGADLLTSMDRTRTGQLVGTLSYMSPEQVAGEPTALDQRSDVYTLGVVLYELLAGRLPYLVKDVPLPEAVRLIQEQEPSRLGSINAHLRGDVETIVAKALEKDRARRYASAAELAADIRRHLHSEPIRARPPSALYQLRKFARRHKSLVGGVAATVGALVLGLVGTVLFAIGEARQRNEAEHNARQSLFQTYRARIAAATAALSAHDVANAASQLDAAPEELRDWEWRHLKSRLDDSSMVIALPAGAAAFLLPATDGIQIGTLTDAGLRLTDLESGAHKTVPISHERKDSVTVTQTRRGLRIVTWVGNTAFDLLDEAGQVLCHMEIPQATEPHPVVVSADGTRLVTIYSESVDLEQLAVFDAKSGKPTAIFDCHHRPRSFAFSPDGARLASASEDGTVRLWDPATGALLATCRGHTSKVLGVAFSPDGARLATTSADGTVRQWDCRTGQEVEAPYERHSGEVDVAVYSPDGHWLASAGTDRTIRVWRATGREDVAVLHGHTGAVTDVAFAPGGRRLASFSRERGLGWAGDDTARVWEVDPQATLPVLRGHTSYVYPVAFSPDGDWIASGGWDKTVRLWDARTGESCAILPHPGIVPTLAYSPDGRWLVASSEGEDRIRIWDVATAHVRTQIKVPGSVRSLILSPDGRRVAATAWAPEKDPLCVYDVASRERVFSTEGKALAYSRDGRWLAVRAADMKTVLLLDALTYDVAARLSGHTAEVQGATFSPDSRLLASYGADQIVRLWRIDSMAAASPSGRGKERGMVECQELRGHTDEIFAAAFHPDGTRLATAGRDQAILLWDLARGEEVARLPGHRSYVWSLAFSPDGTTLASGSGDFTVRLWDTAPLKTRYQARREAEAQRPEAERLVERLSRELKDATKVVAALRADASLSEAQKHAALRAVLRRSARE
jgi:WD40 repeat protein/serine/threonine protein kinase